MIREIALAILTVGLLSPQHANNGVSFVAERYYFELSYGDRMEFYQESYLPGSKIWKTDFRSILRIELPGQGNSYHSFSVPALAGKARVSWNPSGSLAFAALGERVFILTPEFHLLKAYRNTEEVRWVNDSEIAASVETGGPVSKYDRHGFTINVRTDTYRRLP